MSMYSYDLMRSRFTPATKKQRQGRGGHKKSIKSKGSPSVETLGVEITGRRFLGIVAWRHIHSNSFYFVTYEWVQQGRKFVTGKPLRPSVV
jgi:hypothetical protein